MGFGRLRPRLEEAPRHADDFVSQKSGMLTGIMLAAYVVCQGLPELAVDEGNHTAGVFWCSAMILAMTLLAHEILGISWSRQTNLA